MRKRCGEGSDFGYELASYLEARRLGQWGAEEDALLLCLSDWMGHAARYGSECARF